MIIKKLLLVCEGPSDIALIDEITKVLTNKNGHQISVIDLSPQLDSTTGHYPAHGWTEVKNWCETYRIKTPKDVEHAPELLRGLLLRKNWNNIMLAAKADGIIIQIDADIAEQISHSPNFSSSGLDRKTYVKQAVEFWLNQPIAAPLYLLISLYSSETWLLACHDRSLAIFNHLTAGFNFEDISNVETLLIQAGGYKITTKNGIQRLKKKKNLYHMYGKSLVASLSQVRNNCKELDNFCNYIESI